MPKRDIFEISKKLGKRKILSLIVTRDCNLNCRYCYEKTKPNNGQVMDFDMAKETITRFMDADDGFKDIEIEFFGGEPFLAFHLIKNIVEWFYTRSWKKNHIFMISTNGTLLNNEMMNWLDKYKQTVIVAFSIDGTAKSHNLSRGGSFKLVKKIIPFCLKNWPNQPAKMTVGAENIPYVAESVIYLENLGVVFTANVVMENIWGDEANKKKLLHIYKEQLDILVDFYSKNPQLIPVFPMLRSFPLYMGLPDVKRNALPVMERYCGAGHEMRVVDIDGQIYPCHRFLPWITNRITPIPENVNCQKVWEPETCKNCKVFSSCPTCAGFNWEINGNTGNRTTFHCESFKLELKASAKLESLKIKQITPSAMKTMDAFERKEMKMRMAIIFDILKNGV